METIHSIAFLKSGRILRRFVDTSKNSQSLRIREKITNENWCEKLARDLEIQTDHQIPASEKNQVIVDKKKKRKKKENKRAL